MYSRIAILLAVTISFSQKMLTKGPDDEKIIRRAAYTVGFSEQHKQPYWVGYKLDKTRLDGKVQVVKEIKVDSTVSGSDAKDYRWSGFVAGFLAPEEDFMWSTQALFDVYYYSNTSPQNTYFKGLTWQRMSELTRKWARTDSSLYIVAGPVLTVPLKAIGKNKVSVPETFFKVILKDTDPPKAIGFLIANKPTTESLNKFAVSVDSVEAVTGLDFFSFLEDSREESLEKGFDLTQWKF